MYIGCDCLLLYTGQADNVRYIQALHDCKSQRALKALLKAIGMLDSVTYNIYCMSVNAYVCLHCTVFVEGKRAGDVQKAEMARVAVEMEKQVDSIARIKAQQRMEVCTHTHLFSVPCVAFCVLILSTPL